MLHAYCVILHCGKERESNDLEKGHHQGMSETPAGSTPATGSAAATSDADLKNETKVVKETTTVISTEAASDVAATTGN